MVMNGLKLAMLAAVLRKKKNYISKVIATGPLIYYPMNETAGATATNYGSLASANGTYSGVELANALGPDGVNSCPLFNGDYLDVYSAAAAAAFNPNLGTIMAWAKVSGAGDWTDGVQHTIVRLGTGDNNNVIYLAKITTNGQFDGVYKAGGTASLRRKTGMAETGWMHWAITWDKTADEVRVYYNGTQEGATLTGLGVWVGAWHANLNLVGAISKAFATPWLGWIAHFGMWDSARTPAQIAALAVAT